MPNPVTDIPKPLSISQPGESVQLHTRTLEHVPALHQAIMDNPAHFTDAGELTAIKYANIEDMINEVDHPDPDVHHLTIAVDAVPVGSLSYTTNPEFNYAYVGWWVGYRHRGNRFAGRALLLLAGYAFENTQVPSLHARIRPTNTPSIRTVKAVGFDRLGKTDEFDHYWLSRLMWTERQAT